jgi:S-DNA-T family DNA segregation ATPase FtsK/SpoIIIE
MEMKADGMLLASLGTMAKVMDGFAGINIPWYTYSGLIGAGVLATTYSIFSTEDQFEKLFKSMKLMNAAGEVPKRLSKTKTEYGYDYIFSLPDGLNITHFTERKLSIEQSLNAKVKFEYDDKKMIMHYTPNILTDFYPFFPIPTSHPCEFNLGHTAEGLKNILLDRHMLIAGTSGFGKSTLELGIIVQFIRNNTPDTMILNLTDFKRCELGIFKDSNMVHSFCYTEKELEKLLIKLGKESERRYELFDSLKVKDIATYNANFTPKLKYIVNFYDEISQLEGNDRILTHFQKRLAIDRGAGIYHILCTQRPSADLLPGRIKANLDIRIAFRCVDSTNSWIVLDQKETAEYLTIKGRGLLKYGGELEEFQAMYIKEDQAIELTKHTFIDKQRRETDVDGKRQNDN